MANIYKRHDWSEINLTASVGENGVNNRDDVLVVQAMLKYGLEGRTYFKGDRFPEPNGTIDPATMHLIRKYQQYLRRRQGLAISVDGRVDPAKGESAFGRKGQWTIQALNGDVHEWYLLFGETGDNYIHSLCMTYPQVIQAVGGDIPVGSLGLTLESSPAIVGSLNLALE
ncbi:MAG: hypothetical protein J5I65_12980 [Aridibacter famidurans]|nr:hypothetical protein [Aridibacter famidurans]